MTDIFIADDNSTPLTEDLNWGAKSLTKISELRRKYISALRCADNGSYIELLDFVTNN